MEPDPESDKGGIRLPESDSLLSGADRASSSLCPGASCTSEASDTTSEDGAGAGGGQAPGKPLGSGTPGTGTGWPVGGGGGGPGIPAPVPVPVPPEPPVDVGAVEDGEDDDEAFCVYQAGGV
ncbi:hypothetical protein [Streptomyces javensis]|uniref:Uncharacterized protein n=2 Tax=Streptomyces javensis TaxID=114698 RepID=A0ABP4HYU6_9ACTN|nr:hypothetical protein [Streptomyces javensis]MBI0319819.1 hypothetical protein [Streptomyces javensis]